MKRVLIIEDDEDMSFLLSELASDFGHESKTVANADDLTILLDDCSKRKISYDIIFMDATIPGITFPELYEEIKNCSYCNTAQLFLLSGRHDIKELRERYPVDGTLLKPFEVKNIEAILQN